MEQGKVKVHLIGQSHPICHHFEEFWKYIQQRKKLGKHIIICQEDFMFNNIESKKRSAIYEDLKNRWELEDKHLESFESFKAISIKKVNENRVAYNKKYNKNIQLWNSVLIN